MSNIEYRVELREGNELLATGHLSSARPFEVGESIEFTGRRATVQAIEPVLGRRELRLIVEVVRENA